MNIIKANEIVQYQFYAIPQALFTQEKYKKTLSLEAKMIYSFLLDRLSLSPKNCWYDNENNVFLIYKRKDISDILELSEKTTIKAFKELKNVDLLYEKRQGLGKPNLIYLGKVILDNQEKTILQFKNCSTKYLIACLFNAANEYYSDSEIEYRIDSLN